MGGGGGGAVGHKEAYKNTNIEADMMMTMWDWRYCLDKYSLMIWTITVTLTLEDTYPISSHNTPAHDDAQLYNIWL